MTSKIKRLQTPTILTISLIVLLLFPDFSYALRPYRFTDSAKPINRGNSMLEVGVRSIRRPDNTKTKVMTGDLTFGLINNLDFKVEIPYITQKNNKELTGGMADLTIKGKLTFLKEREANRLSLAGMFIAKFPSCNEDAPLSDKCTGEPDQGIKFIATRIFFPENHMPLKVHLNFGKFYLGNPPGIRLKDVIAYSIAAEISCKINKIILVSELSGETNRLSKISEDQQHLLLGVKTKISSRVMLDGSVSVGTTKSSDNYGLNAGFTYRF